MKKKARLKKWHKGALITIGSIIAVILILAIFVNRYWSPIMAAKVKKMVLASSDSLYHVDFSGAKFHILRGELDIYDITIKPDTAVYNRRLKNHIAPNNLVELHVKRLVISHIHPFKLYFQRKLDIGEIALTQPEINLAYHLNHTKDTVTKDNRTTWQKISKTLNSIHIGQISLSDVKLRYEDYAGEKPSVSNLKDMSLSATDLLIDSTTQTDRSRVLYCKNIDAMLDNYSGRSLNGLYAYHIKSIHLSTQTSRLNINGLDLQPVKAEVFFNKTYHDRFKVHLDSLQLDHFDYLTYHKYRILNASVLRLNTGSVAITGNPRQLPNHNDRVKSYPHFALRQLSASITIDTIRARYINISYTEYNPKSKETGTVRFDNTDGLITNVTTDKDRLQKNHICMARLSSYFMNTGKLEAVFNFDLTDKNASFSYKGGMGPMNIPAINEATMPLALVKFNTGRVKQVFFDIKANARTANGRVSVLYNDLKVTVLKPDTAHDRLKHMTIASLWANVMVLKHDNPDNDDDPPRSVNVHYYRPDTVAFFGSIWQTLFAGFKPCAGLDKQMQENVKAQLANQKIKKAERQIKKAERKQRREERRRNRELKKEQKEGDEQQAAGSSPAGNP